MNVTIFSLLSTLSILHAAIGVPALATAAVSAASPAGASATAPSFESGAKLEAAERGNAVEKEKISIEKPARMIKKKKSRAAVNKTPLPDERLTVKDVLDALKKDRNLSGKNLSGLHLTGLDLKGCNLKGADLRNTNLERSNLEEANLELAELSGANMKMADLRSAGLRGARLERTILDGAIWEDGTVCEKGSSGFCRERHPRP